MRLQHQLLLAALTLTGLGASSVARAQNIPKPWAIKLGVRLPTDKTVRNEVGQVWFSAGVSYDIARSAPGSRLLYQAYADYAYRESLGGGGVSAVSFYNANTKKGWLAGFGPAVKLLLAPTSAPQQVYVGAGVGFYNARVPQYGTVYGFSGEPLGRGIVSARSAVRPGGKLFAGIQTSRGFFAEVDYTYVGTIGGVQPGGAGYRLGVRF